MFKKEIIVAIMSNLIIKFVKIFNFLQVLIYKASLLYLLDYISLTTISKCGDRKKIKIKIEMGLKYSTIHDKW